MAETYKQLGQARPSNTSAASLYSQSTSGVQTIAKKLIICNTTATKVSYRVFHDDNGTTYDQSTALVYDSPLSGNETYVLTLDICTNDNTGNIAVRTDTANAITFTLYGLEIT